MSDALKETETAGGALAVTVQTFLVVDSGTYQRGIELLKAIKQYLARVAEVMGPIIRAAHEAHKTALDQRKRLEDPVRRAETILKTRLETWDRGERERLRAEQARAAAEAQEQARLEALRAAEVHGDEGLVAAIATADPTPSLAFAPPIEELPKAEGVSYRVTWSAEITDFAALVRAVAAGQAPIKVLTPDMVTLNSMARALREAFALPGVRAVSRRGVLVKIDEP